jgi:transposase-like protein
MPKKNPRSEAAPANLQEAIRYFADPDIALAYMMTIRWPDGEVSCPTCGSKAVRFIATRRVWQCGGQHPRRQFSVKVGTVMEDSPIGLDKWLCAFWLLANCKNGISSYELARNLDITQKSGWFVLHRVRLAMQEGSLLKIGGSGKTVEVDETFIGGKARMMNAKQRAKAQTPTTDERTRRKGHREKFGKAIVLGMLERGGKVVAKVVTSRRRKALVPMMLDHVEPQSEVHTDELKSYSIFRETFSPAEFEHKVIDHTVSYVDGNVHTNNIENFWSLLKRGLRGTYVSVEPFHLFRYLDEQAFRFNARKETDQSRFLTVLSMVAGKRLTYKQLIGEGLLGGHPA